MVQQQSVEAFIFSFLFFTVVQWLSEHKEFISNPFYVSGDSYSGKIIPAMVQEISKGMCVCVLHLLLFSLFRCFIFVTNST